MPLLTTLGAGSRGLGFGASLGGDSLELLASLTVSSTSINSYDLLFDGSMYESVMLSFAAKTGTTSNAGISVGLLYGTTAVYANGTQSVRTGPYVANWSVGSGGITTHLPASNSDSPEGYSLLVGSVNQTGKDKPILGFGMNTFSTEPGWQVFSPGRLARSGTTSVTGMRIQGSSFFSIGSHFRLYGVKAA